VKKGKRIRRRRRTRTLKRIPAWSRFMLRCHSTVYPRERERERERERKRKKINITTRKREKKRYVSMKYV